MIIMTYTLKNKNYALKAFENFIADIAPYGNIKCIRSDQEIEFTFESLLIKNKINHQKVSLYLPYQNNAIERAWSTIFGMTRSILKQANLP